MKELTQKHKSSTTFTEGSLFKGIILFSLPLMASQILQVLFNISDVIIVGKGVADSTVPVGAVGSTSTLLTLFTGFLIGIGAGINVKVAQYLGAKREKDVKETVDTSLVLSAAMGVIIFALCFFLARQLLELLNTKAELLDKAVTYFRIFSFGMPALAIFNYGNGVLSAAGDTKRPLIYLAVSGIANIGLNFFFVLVCGLDVEGVALASVITQYMSAAAVTVRLLKIKDAHRLDLKNFTYKWEKAGEVLALGVPAGIQNGIFAVANIFIQVGINEFEYKQVTGINTAQNADTIIYNIMMAFYTACSTFIGQNYGAGKPARAIRSYYVTTLYAFAFGLVLGALAFFKGDLFLSMFDSDPEVIAAGMQKLKIMGFSFGLSAFMDNAIAASRGIGKSLVPTIVVIIGSCVFRVVWIYTVFAHYKTITSLFLLYPVSWIITGIAETIYFFVSYVALKKRKSSDFQPTDAGQE